ncbi:MAG: DUF3310 domain-containing protein [Erysipelotrichaceae bacterium]
MSKFKVGDKVRVLSNDSEAVNECSEYFDVGDISVVHETDSYGGVRISDTKRSWIAVEELELIESNNNNLILNQDHYIENGIQPFDIMKANFTKEQWYGFLFGNAQKYITRHERKNKVEDLKKAITYITLMIEEYDNGNKE